MPKTKNKPDMKIGVTGAAGSMGLMLIAEVAGRAGLSLAGGTERAGHPSLGRDLGELAGLGRLGLPLADDAAALFADSDAVLDFTSSAASARHAALAAEHKTLLVLGTTGIDGAAERAIRKAAEGTAIVWAANTSLGVTLLAALVEQAAARLGDSYDIEILEMHHRRKIDAPSGTALALGRAAAKGRGVTLDKVAVRARDGETGARPAGAIGFAVLRGGDVPGDHSVIFAGDGERLELTHRASSRRVFAQGAVAAALWGRDKPPGLYSMRDVLGI
jgi:4-hydroxy-tetrahydrodipicolinate reductase